MAQAVVSEQQAGDCRCRKRSRASWRSVRKREEVREKNNAAAAEGHGRRGQLPVGRFIRAAVGALDLPASLAELSIACKEQPSVVAERVHSTRSRRSGRPNDLVPGGQGRQGAQQAI